MELVYGRISYVEGHRVSLRIHTAINPSGESREIGSDAIRMRLFFMVAGQDKPVSVGRPFRCLRVKNWKKNMTEAISAITSKDNLPTCALCKSPMAIRDGREGQEFWGCANYVFTKCKGKPATEKPPQRHHDEIPPWELDDMEENS